MSRKKLERVVPLEKAKTRAASLESIDPALDLGDGFKFECLYCKQ